MKANVSAILAVLMLAACATPKVETAARYPETISCGEIDQELQRLAEIERAFADNSSGSKAAGEAAGAALFLGLPLLFSLFQEDSVANQAKARKEIESKRAELHEHKRKRGCEG